MMMRPASAPRAGRPQRSASEELNSATKLRPAQAVRTPCFPSELLHCAASLYSSTLRSFTCKAAGKSRTSATSSVAVAQVCHSLRSMRAAGCSRRGRRAHSGCQTRVPDARRCRASCLLGDSARRDRGASSRPRAGAASNRRRDPSAASARGHGRALSARICRRRARALDSARGRPPFACPWHHRPPAACPAPSPCPSRRLCRDTGPTRGPCRGSGRARRCAHRAGATSQGWSCASRRSRSRPGQRSGHTQAPGLNSLHALAVLSYRLRWVRRAAQLARICDRDAAAACPCLVQAQHRRPCAPWRRDRAARHAS